MQIFTVRKRSCRKVMFSQACVMNSVRGGRCTPLSADTPYRADTPQADTPQADTASWADTPWADTTLCSRPPQQTATAADGTHPTGMNSCFT